LAIKAQQGGPYTLTPSIAECFVFQTSVLAVTYILKTEQGITHKFARLRIHHFQRKVMSVIKRKSQVRNTCRFRKSISSQCMSLFKYDKRALSVMHIRFMSVFRFL